MLLFIHLQNENHVEMYIFPPNVCWLIYLSNIHVLYYNHPTVYSYLYEMRFQTSLLNSALGVPKMKIHPGITVQDGKASVKFAQIKEAGGNRIVIAVD